MSSRVDDLERSLEAANEPIVEVRLLLVPVDRRGELFAVMRSEDMGGGSVRNEISTDSDPTKGDNMAVKRGFYS